MFFFFCFSMDFGYGEIKLAMFCVYTFFVNGKLGMHRARTCCRYFYSQNSRGY